MIFRSLIFIWMVVLAFAPEVFSQDRSRTRELGSLETPIGLTSTLSVFRVADGLAEYMLGQPGNEDVRSVNPVAGETNDGWLNDIRGRYVNTSHVFEAIDAAESGPVGEELGGHYMSGRVPYQLDGSCMIIVATDAPLLSRNLKRLAMRSFLAFGRVGGFSSNGSGDYAIAFSTHPECRISHHSPEPFREIPQLRNDRMSPLFLAVVEATEEAIYNSLFMATTMKGKSGRTVEALPVAETLKIMDRYRARSIKSTQ